MFRNILVVEDRREHLDFLREALEFAGSELNLSTAKDLADAEHKIVEGTDLYILDLELPDGSGIELIPDIRAKSPGARVMIYTVFDEDELFFKAMRMGIDGYILKTETQQNLIGAIRDVYRGMAALSPALARKVMNFHAASSNQMPELTDKEMGVLRLIAQGHTMKSAAENLNRSVDTVKFHVKEIYRKTGAQNRTALLRLAHEMGIS